MKTRIHFYLMLLLLLFQSTPISAMDLPGLFQMIKAPKLYLLSHPEVLKTQLEKIVNARCKRFIPESLKECSLASVQFVRALDLTAIQMDKETYSISLAKDLEQVFQDQRLEAYLLDLNSQLDKTIQDLAVYKFINPKMVRPFDLGALTLQHFKNQKSAIKVMGTLFQDIFPAGVPTHLTYLYERFGESDQLKLLLEINNKIGNLTFKDGSVALTIFGNQMPSMKIYHYLVPALLSQKMAHVNPRKDLSFIMPFMLNYIYEIGAEHPLRAYFMEPKSISLRAHQDDIRLGEMGAAMGLGKKPLLSEKETRTLLERDPSAYIRKILALTRF